MRAKRARLLNIFIICDNKYIIMSDRVARIGVCWRCNGNMYSGLHPLLQDVFNIACKCNVKCKCGKYIDDYETALKWNPSLRCNCILKQERASKELERIQQEMYSMYLLKPSKSLM